MQTRQEHKQHNNMTKTAVKIPRKPKTKQPDINLDSLLEGAAQGEINAKLIALKQQAVKEFLQSLKNEGYKIVPAKKK